MQNAIDTIMAYTLLSTCRERKRESLSLPSRVQVSASVLAPTRPLSQKQALFETRYLSVYWAVPQHSVEAVCFSPAVINVWKGRVSPDVLLGEVTRQALHK